MRGLSCALLFSSVAVPAQANGPLEFDEVGDETYAEQIVALADLSDGTYAKIRFGVSNVGPGDGKGGCEFFVIDPKGKLWRDEVVVDRSKRKYDAKNQKLHIGPCTATSNGRLVMKAPLSKGTVEITLTENPARQRAHAAKIGDEFYELDLLVKWSDAEVVMTRDGKTRTLKGRGYADHPRSKILPGTLAKRWFRFRGLSKTDPRVVMIRFPQSGNPIGWHDSAHHGHTNLDRVMLSPAKDKGWKARFKGEGGEWRVTTTKLLHRSAPIEDRGAVLGSMIGAVVGNPVTYTYRGVLEERGSGAKIPGIVEVTITDE